MKKLLSDVKCQYSSNSKIFSVILIFIYANILLSRNTQHNIPNLNCYLFNDIFNSSIISHNVIGINGVLIAFDTELAIVN